MKCSLCKEEVSSENHNGHSELLCKYRPLRFELNGKQVKLLMKWDKQHVKRSHGNKETAGGRLMYSFTPTGIGDAVSVTCVVCRETMDLTDFDSW